MARRWSFTLSIVVSIEMPAVDCWHDYEAHTQKYHLAGAHSILHRNTCSLTEHQDVIDSLSCVCMSIICMTTIIEMMLF